jgi:hypothetical protein
MSRIGWWLVALSMIAAAPASAWSDQAHMATGLIAYDQLATRDPAAIAVIDALIAAHPDRARFDSALAGLEGAERERRLFELIARWPDDIRATPYSHRHWHHQLRVVTGWKAFRGPRVGKADYAFRHALRLLRDPKADPGRRAIALCWLFHVVGDMHQPLHAGQRMDEHFPLTDLAGTTGWVRRSADAPPETLHHFWDTAADRPEDEMAGAAAIAEAAEANSQPVAEASGDVLVDYRGWVRESEQVAADTAYPGAIEGEMHSRKRAGMLTLDYVATARDVAERRIKQAGMRLANLLAALFPAI